MSFATSTAHQAATVMIQIITLKQIQTMIVRMIEKEMISASLRMVQAIVLGAVPNVQDLVHLIDIEMLDQDANQEAVQTEDLVHIHTGNKRNLEILCTC